MIKTKLLYQWNPENAGEVYGNPTRKTVTINKNGIVLFIQVISSKPLEIFSEKQKSNI